MMASQVKGKGKDKKDVAALCVPSSLPGECAWCSRGRCVGCVPSGLDARGFYLDKRGACSPW